MGHLRHGLFTTLGLLGFETVLKLRLWLALFFEYFCADCLDLGSIAYRLDTEVASGTVSIAPKIE